MVIFCRSCIAALLVMSGAAFSKETLLAKQQPDSTAPHLRIARFWRGEGRTLLRGVIGLPVAQLNRTVTVTVNDSAGKTLFTEAWTDTASSQAAALIAMNAESATSVELLLDPGLYDVSVQSRVGDHSNSTKLPLRAFAAAPVMSDVVVSAQMRVLAEKEKPLPAEVQFGRYAIERGAAVTVLPASPRLWYYLELYRQGPDSIAQLMFEVRRAGADSSLVRVSRRVAVGARGTIDAAAMVVQGLPPGDYSLRVTATNGTRTETREAAFRMASLEDTPAYSVTPESSGAEGGLLDRYFSLAVRSDADINALLEAMTVGAPGDRVPDEMLTLTTDAKRRFLARYWSRVPDPNPTTPQHELVDEYTLRVAHVSREFREGGRGGRSGVKTDRGRIYLKWGAPDTTLELQIPGSNKVVEIWKYTVRQALKYAFIDETGFRTFNLLYTTDRAERGLPDWQDRIRHFDSIRQIMNF